MTKSIIGLLLLAAIGSLVASVLSNLMRVQEIRELRKQIRRYEEAFERARSSVKIKYITKYKEPEIKVTDENEEPLKFGDE